MGQYYYVVNTTKKQYLHPHRFEDGLKLREFGASGRGTMMTLSALLADGCGRGGGDIVSDDPIIGSWAGDSIVIAGDYADGGKFLSDEEMARWRETQVPDGDVEPPNLHHFASDHYEDISGKVIAVIAKYR